MAESTSRATPEPPQPGARERAECYARVDLHVWSGTGNTYRAAEWVREAAEARGLEVTLHRAKRLAPLEPRDEGPAPGRRLLGILTPTHAFTAPWHTIRHVARLPWGCWGDAFVLATRAGTKAWGVHIWGLEGTTLFLVALLLLMRGYRTRGTLGLDMPSNWLALHTGLRPPTVASIIRRAEPKTKRFADRLLDGRLAWSGWVSLAFGIMLIPVSAGYLVWGRFYLAKLFFANRRCTGCGLCARWCAVRGIRMVGDPPRPFWTYWCESCMRCMAYCPHQAVEASQSWAVILYYAASALPAWFLAEKAPSISWLAWAAVPWLRFALSYVYFLGAVSIVYLVLATLARCRIPNALFTYTTLTCLYRRYHEPSTSAGDIAGSAREVAEPAGSEAPRARGVTPRAPRG